MFIDDFRWDEKLRLRRDALSCQVLGAPEAQEIETAHARPSRQGREVLVECDLNHILAGNKANRGSAIERVGENRPGSYGNATLAEVERVSLSASGC